MVHGKFNGITLAELAEQSGGKYDTIYRKAKRYFPEFEWSKDAPLSADQIAALSDGNKPERRPPTKREKSVSSNTVHAKPGHKAKPVVRPKNKAWVPYALLIAPTVASVHNMFIVTRDLSGNWFDAVALTIVLSVSALGFVWYGARTWYTISLALLLIGYEAFCNLTRIYGGLMGVGSTWNPTRFMGLVTDIFGSGTHYTAIVLGGITALFLAAVQYAAVIELNKAR